MGGEVRNLKIDAVAVYPRNFVEDLYCGGNEWVCRRSAQSGQRVGQCTSSKLRNS